MANAHIAWSTRVLLTRVVQIKKFGWRKSRKLGGSEYPDDLLITGHVNGICKALLCTFNILHM